MPCDKFIELKFSFLELEKINYSRFILITLEDFFVMDSSLFFVATASKLGVLSCLG